MLDLNGNIRFDSSSGTTVSINLFMFSCRKLLLKAPANYLGYPTSLFRHINQRPSKTNLYWNVIYVRAVSGPGARALGRF